MQERKFVKICPSKSDAQRALICSYLTEVQKTTAGTNYDDARTKAESRVKNISRSRDVLAMKNCLDEILKWAVDSKKNEPDGEAELELVLNADASGATLRFIVPICAALGINAVIRYNGRKRTIDPLGELLRGKGLKVTENEGSIAISGKLEGGNFEIPGNISSQFISGLLFALTLTKDGGSIQIKGILESSGYVKMTIDSLERSGIEVSKDGKTFIVTGGQIYSAPDEYKVEGDWTNAAVWMGINAILLATENKIYKGRSSDFISKAEILTGRHLLDFPIQIRGLNMRSSQPDIAILDIIGRFFDIGKDGNNILKGDNVFDCSEIPDLVPVISVLGAVNDGTTLITNAGRLRLKESNRLETTWDVLGRLGADIEETGDGLIIYGMELPRGNRVQSYGDHRVVMMAAMMSLVVPMLVYIEGSDEVDKSYPEFKEEFKRLGLDENLDWR